jgi:glyceraldehyde 3-phosphate dehydrogenase
MTVKIAINGFGRIGRLAYRAMLEQGIVGKGKAVDVVAVGDIVPADNLAYLVKYDTMQGKFKGEITTSKSSADKADDDILTVNGDAMQVVSAKTPAELPWKAMGVDIVIECTGLFTEAEKAKGHLAAGAKKVIISAPAKGEDITVVMGVITRSTTPSTTSSATPVARPTASSRSFTCSSRKASGSKKA